MQFLKKIENFGLGRSAADFESEERIRVANVLTFFLLFISVLFIPIWIAQGEWAPVYGLFVGLVFFISIIGLNYFGLFNYSRVLFCLSMPLIPFVNGIIQYNTLPENSFAIKLLIIALGITPFVFFSAKEWKLRVLNIIPPIVYLLIYNWADKQLHIIENNSTEFTAISIQAVSFLIVLLILYFSENQIAKLLNKSQAQEAELYKVNLSLEAQQEELRQNLEEMTAAQEELQAQRTAAIALKDQIQSIINSTNDQILALDTDLRVLYFNDVLANFYTAIGLELRVGMELKDIIVGFDYEQFAGYWRRAFTGEVFETETVIQRADGSSAYTELRYSPMRASEGRVTGAVLFMRNVTQMRQLANERDLRNRRLEQQQRAMAALTKDTDITSGNVSAAFHKITETVAATLNVARAGIWLYTENKDGIISDDVYIKDKKIHEKGTVLQVLDFPAYFEAINNENIIAVEDVFTDARTVEFLECYYKPLGIRATLEVLIRRSGKMIGVISCEHAHATRVWQADEISFVSAIAEMVSLTLEVANRNAMQRQIQQTNEALEAQQEELRQNLEEMTATQEEMKRLQQVLQLNAERARKLFDSSADAILIIEEGIISEVNPSALLLFGCSDSGQICGREFGAFVPELQPESQLPSRLLLEQQFQQARLKGAGRFEMQALRMNGSAYRAEVWLSRFDFNGKQGLQLVVRDVSERYAQAAEIAEKTRILVQQQQELESVVQTLQARSAELEQKRFIDRSLADFASVSRWNGNQEVEDWGHSVLQFYAQKVRMIAGALYRADEDVLRFTAGYALSESPKECIKLGEGLIGEVGRSKQAYQLDGIKCADTRLSTAFVSEGVLYIYPILHNEATVGVLELLLTAPLSDSEAYLFNLLNQNLGALLYSIQSTMHIQQLYEESRRQHENLLSKEQELRLNYEKLQQTQAEMHETQVRLQQLNESLEEKVQERTLELEEMLKELKSTQHQLVLREKMATLGSLIAGVAHEINTPIGAVKASTENLEFQLPKFIAGYPEILASLNASTKSLFFELVNAVLNSQSHLSSGEERKVRKEYIRLLEGANIEAAEEIALQLVGGGFYQELTRYMPLFVGKNGLDIAKFIYTVGQFRVNLHNISVAAEKTKKTVFALKSFTHTRLDSEQAVDFELAQNIQTILTLYTNQMKYGVELEVDFKSNPIINANPDAIGQVWTNIISNALQAMNYKGVLKVGLHQEGGYAVVSIRDNGPGIPAEILPRIFEPFFTTKKQGEGTGLGLDICRKIVEQYQGKIEVQSVPGDTCFSVYLPTVGEAVCETEKRMAAAAV